MYSISPGFLVILLRKLITKSEALFKSPALAWLIIAFGITVRCIQYLANRSLWLDESFLALNIVQKTFLELLQPLDYAQGAPIGFLMVEKTIEQLLGNSEFMLRLFPLVSGIASLFLFYMVAKTMLTPKAIIMGLALFAFSEPLIYYSSEAKQYSSDVSVALLLYFLATQCFSRKESKISYAMIFGLIGSVAIWFSHPAIFVLAGIGISLTSFCLIRIDWGTIRHLLMAYTVIMLSFMIFYFLSLDHLIKNDALRSYWANYFMPPLPLSLDNFRLLLSTFFSIFEDPVGLAFVGMGSLCFLVGCRAFLRVHKEKFFMLALPILFTFLAASLKKYPFHSRLLLFIVPSMLFFIAQGMDEIVETIQYRDSIIAIAFATLVFLYPALVAGQRLVKPYMREEIRPLINYMANGQRPNDFLYVYYHAFPAFKYYQKLSKFTDEDYIIGHDLEAWENHLDDLSKLSGKKRVWALFSHLSDPSRIKEEAIILGQLDSMGTRLAALKDSRASVYLYELTAPAKP